MHKHAHQQVYTHIHTQQRHRHAHIHTHRGTREHAEEASFFARALAASGGRAKVYMGESFGFGMEDFEKCRGESPLVALPPGLSSIAEFDDITVSMTLGEQRW